LRTRSTVASLTPAWRAISRIGYGCGTALGVTAAAALLLVVTATVVPAILRLRNDPVQLLAAE
jgi:hypothetical protein